MNPAPPDVPAQPPVARGSVSLNAGAKSAECPRYRSEALFAGANEIQIERDSRLYRLRRTALGKLILTK